MIDLQEIKTHSDPQRRGVPPSTWRAHLKEKTLIPCQVSDTSLAHELSARYQLSAVVAACDLDGDYEIDWMVLAASGTCLTACRLLIAGDDHYCLPGVLVQRILQANAENPCLKLIGGSLLVGQRGFSDLGRFRGLDPHQAMKLFHRARSDRECDWDWLDWSRGRG
ncbi:hypothetical protein DYH09_09565 [bacterium CPR1]|nr:hypothetical protein [bacterium CPR1]